ncbi:hypothetical protein [Streptomyces sp. NPDC058295]|uniref:hypothetical protein n=1 Tax=Streptomyces sp. NPDC058295 TaxID=3346431 RepID=UPI0036E886DF
MPVCDTDAVNSPEDAEDAAPAAHAELAAHKARQWLLGGLLLALARLPPVAFGAGLLVLFVLWRDSPALTLLILFTAIVTRGALGAPTGLWRRAAVTAASSAVLGAVAGLVLTDGSLVRTVTFALCAGTLATSAWALSAPQP